MVIRVFVALLAVLGLRGVASACEDPVDYGAIPDDGMSDRAAIQAAIDADPFGTVCLGLGRWTVERAPLTAYNRFAAVATHSGTAITGQGPGTVLELVGDQGGGGVSVISIDPGAFGARISDLTIDTSAATNTDEQTHAIQVGSSVCLSPLLGGCLPVLNTRIDRVVFIHPAAAAPSRKGDCVRLLGNSAASQVRRVSLVGGVYSQCARSGVSIQRNVYELSIVGNLFQNATDQDIDSEPTGGVGDLNSDVLISSNIFADDRASSQGDHAVTIGGAGGPMARVVVSNNIFNGRGIRLYRSSDVVISGNVIRADMTAPGSGVIEAGNVTDGLTIIGNTIRRVGAAGPLIRTFPQSGAFPGPLSILSNRLIQGTASDAVYVESTDGVLVASNRVDYLVSASAFTAFSFRATARNTLGVAVRGNTVGAGPGFAVRFTASPWSISDLYVTDNAAATPVGVVCSAAGGAAVGDILSSGNKIGARMCAATFITGD